ncbi:MAG: DUF2130 domain-containing protein [Bacteroidetes bacterium]|nr:DUF2130 domain-containing protein [Bacteroidota bacterium]
MNVNSKITCPNCKNEFEATEAFREELKREFNAKAQAWQKEKTLEFEKKELEFQKQLKTVAFETKQHTEQELQKQLSEKYELQIKTMHETIKVNEEKISEARAKELEYLKKENELKNKEAELEITLQKKLQTERQAILEQIKKQEQEKTSLRENEFIQKINELNKQLDDQKKLADEMKRKAEQGSMQLQGEVQELALEDLLRSSFPFDAIEEVAKGVRGADCVQIVKNNFADVCGKIIYESKRTKAFSGEWIEKLKADMLSQQADIAVIVTETLPKDQHQFGFKDGVWICRFSEVKSLAFLLRESLIKVANALKNNENKGEKMSMLYNYLIGSEFSSQWQAIREGFLNMQTMIQKERDTMEKLWKAREKQLEKVLLNAAHIKGSIEGIAGQNTIDLTLDNKDLLLD